MKKVIIASHHNLAKGLKATLNYISPNTVEIIDVNAYVDEKNLEKAVDTALGQFETGEQIIAFTDMVGGSVNQEFAKRLGEYNLQLISGVNLPVALAIILSLGEKELSADMIRMTVEEARQQLVYVNDSLLSQEMDDDDE